MLPARFPPCATVATAAHAPQWCSLLTRQLPLLAPRLCPLLPDRYTYRCPPRATVVIAAHPPLPLLAPQWPPPCAAVVFSAHPPASPPCATMVPAAAAHPPPCAKMVLAAHPPAATLGNCNTRWTGCWKGAIASSNSHPRFPTLVSDVTMRRCFPVRCPTFENVTAAAWSPSTRCVDLRVEFDGDVLGSVPRMAQLLLQLLLLCRCFFRQQ